MKIICFGDSNTFGYDPRGYFGGRYKYPWPQILAQKMRWTVTNHGENGIEVPTKVMNFPSDVDYLIIMLGTNDILQGTAPEETSRKMEGFLKSLSQEKVLLISPPPMTLGTWVTHQSLIDASKSIANHYRAIAERLDICFADAGMWNIPLAYDGVHLTEEGHRAFAERLIEYLTTKEIELC